MKALALALTLACAALGAAHAQAVSDADADRRFEPVAFRLFASNAGYGTGRHAAVALSPHGPVQSVAPYPQGFTLDRRFDFPNPAVCGGGGSENRRWGSF